MDTHDIPLKMAEYRYKGNKYASIKYHFKHDWFKVEPITWLIDTNTKLAITEKILLSGINYGNNENIINIFQQSNISYYLNRYFSNELYVSEIPNEEIKRSEDNRISYLKNIKYDLTDKLLKVELLEVKIKTDLFTKKMQRTSEVQELLSQLKEKERLIEQQIKEIDNEINDCTNEDVYDTKKLIKRLS